MTQILIVGSGAREHAFVRAFLKNKQISRIFVAPGNVGMLEATKTVQVVDFKTIDELVSFAQAETIDLTLMGDASLVEAGIVDEFEKVGLRAYGPTNEASRFNQTKAHMIDLVKALKIPTAPYVKTETLLEAKAVLETLQYPIVMKLDRAKGTKEVGIYDNRTDALISVNQYYMADRHATVVMEDIMHGPEFSICSFVGIDQVLHAPVVQSNKRLYDNSVGPLTPGMGANSPIRWLNPAIIDQTIAHLIDPLLEGLVEQGTPFKGVLQTDVILTDDGPKLIEYHTNFEQTEAQVILPQLKSDLFEVITQLLDGTPTAMNWQNDNIFLGATLVAPGYPGQSQKGVPIPELPVEVEIDFEDVEERSGQFISATSGRVLTAVIQRPTMTAAQIDLSVMLDETQTELLYRHDIGKQALDAEQAGKEK